MIDVEQLSPNGFQLSNVFPMDVLTDLSSVCDTFEPDHTRSSGKGIRHSKVLNVNNEQYVINLISQITQKPIESYGSEIWRDYPDYNNDIHVDDPRIENIMIVYLDSGPETLGTHWFENDIEYRVPYTRNCGLVLLNSNKIPHGMIGSVTDVDYRKSFYANWKTPK